MAARIESVGACDICGLSFGKRQMLSHLSQCGYPESKSLAAVTHLRVDVPGSPYWLDLDVKTTATMRDIDDFLRGIWLECCDHLSSFQVGDVGYALVMSDPFLGFGREPKERSMNARVSERLCHR